MSMFAGRWQLIRYIQMYKFVLRTKQTWKHENGYNRWKRLKLVVVAAVVMAVVVVVVADVFTICQWVKCVHHWLRGILLSFSLAARSIMIIGLFLLVHFYSQWFSFPARYSRIAIKSIFIYIWRFTPFHSFITVIIVLSLRNEVEHDRDISHLAIAILFGNNCGKFSPKKLFRIISTEICVKYIYLVE